MIDSISEEKTPNCSDFLEYLKQNKIQFKEFDYIEGEYEGASPKSFVLLDDSQSKEDIPSTARTMQDSKYFAHLFYEIKNNPDTSLVTYLNDSIKDGVFPRYVSCLAKNCIFSIKKDTIDDGRNASEVIGSKIAELLGVPTVCTIGIPAIDGSIGTIMSVDFLKQGETFEDLLTLLNNKATVEMSDPIEKWKLAFRKALRKKYLYLDKESLAKLEKVDLPKMLLFRKGGLFKDVDLQPYNQGIVFSGRKFKLAPSFDMECLLETMKCDSDFYSIDRGSMRDIVSHCAQNCPDVLEDFVNRLNKNMANGAIPSIIKSYYPNNNARRNILKNLDSTVIELNTEVEKYMSRSSER